MPRDTISISEARRISLTAQGFGSARPKGPINAGHIQRAVRKLGLLQLDFVNVLVPAHQLVVFSRLGPYDRARFHDAIYRRGDFTEQWAHEASIVPTSFWPLLEYRRQAYRPYPNSSILKLKGKSKYLKQVFDLIEQNGGLTSQDLPPMAGPKRNPGDWHRSVPRWALEVHFGSGKLAVADRLPNYQRIYDLPERVIDARHLEHKVDPNEGRRELLKIAANASGIATTADLADYFRMSGRDAQPRIDELVEEGAVRQVTVEGWKDKAYVSTAARLPRKVSCSTLLSPFDPVVWYRPRAERLFDFHYRIEIYVPAAKRKWGYYVLPYLLDDRIVARVDLKADRKNRCLLVLASHQENNIDVTRTVNKLSDELRSLADWLGLERIKVSRRGSFARHLADRIKAKGFA